MLSRNYLMSCVSYGAQARLDEVYSDEIGITCSR